MSVLVQAHELATLAEQAYRKQEYERALEYHHKAEDGFRDAAAATNDDSNVQALNLLADAQKGRAECSERRLRGSTGATSTTRLGEQLSSVHTAHAKAVQLHPPSSQGGVAISRAGQAPAGSSILDVNTTRPGGVYGPYESPSMRVQSNDVPASWYSWPFLPAPVQTLFDQLTQLMDLLPNVSSSPAATAIPVSAGMGADSTTNIPTGPGGMRLGGSVEPHRMQEELEALQRSLSASMMIRKEHDKAVGRFREEVGELLDMTRTSLNDFFSHNSSMASQNTSLDGYTQIAPPPVEDQAALAAEQAKTAALEARVRALEAESAEQKDMLRRHQERWQRVRDEYAKKKQEAVAQRDPV